MVQSKEREKKRDQTGKKARESRTGCKHREKREIVTRLKVEGDKLRKRYGNGHTEWDRAR